MTIIGFPSERKWMYLALSPIKLIEISNWDMLSGLPVFRIPRFDLLLFSPAKMTYLSLFGMDNFSNKDGRKDGRNILILGFHQQSHESRWYQSMIIRVLMGLDSDMYSTIYDMRGFCKKLWHPEFLEPPISICHQNKNIKHWPVSMDLDSSKLNVSNLLPWGSLHRSGKNPWENPRMCDPPSRKLVDKPHYL